MSKKQGNILVIGAGSVGRRHIENLFCLGYSNVAVLDPDQATLNTLERNFSVRGYVDVRMALKKEQPAVVFVCSPTALHVRHTRAALDAGAHVFIEKPLSHNSTGVDALMKKAAQKKRVVMVGCNFRFNKSWQALERALASRRYGTPLHARVAFGYFLPVARKGVDYKKIYAAQKQGGGVTLDSGSHVIDYLTALFGVIKKSTTAKSALRPLGTKADEIAHILLEHTSGVATNVSLDYISKRPTHRIEVTTEQGTLTLDVKKEQLVFDDGKKIKKLYQGTGRDHDESFIEEIKHFFSCIKIPKKPLQGLSEARRVIELMG